MRQWFAFARCDDGLKVVLEGLANPEDADTWEHARKNAVTYHCNPASVFILPYDEAMQTYGAVIQNHFHLREIELEQNMAELRARHPDWTFDG